jgi:hypothetical protein
MKSDKPLRKSLVCGVVLLVAIAIILAGVSGAQNLSYRLGYLMPPCLIAIIVTGTWGYFSKKAWSWARFGITVVIVYVCFNLGLAFLRASAHETGWNADAEVVELNHVHDSQQELAKKLDAVKDAATLVRLMDELTDSANQLKSIIAKEKQAGAVQSETSKKKVYDAAVEAGRAFALNYRTAADAVPKYNADPNVVAAWDKLKTTAEPICK